ncbi:acyltransferase [Bradyrhizobium lablabi]|uniref:acyltransferase family protein n=1 Tax=Bradyrhizobium lablabi TaxID=722472 RepID=UPI001BA4BCC8|nr:acyltransferase [Bradyrhizobium lablabi]MBR0696456.1 acyltransferase [Bradyrhizobium lablabi]
MAGQPISGLGRFEALDALRGICALLVVLFHIPIYHALKGTQPFANLQFCVDMFFALSGFVLCHAYGHRLHDRADGLRFAVSRFARLWPLHIVMLVLFIGIEVVKIVFLRADGSLSLDSVPFGEGHTPWQMITNVLFLQSFHLHAGLTWNGPAWSAAVEFYVSLLFAVVILLFPQRRREIFLGLCLAAGMQLFERSPQQLFVSHDWGMLRAMFSFFAGCLVYDMRLHSNGRLETPNMLEVWSVLLVAAFVVCTQPGEMQYAFPLLAAIVIYVFSFDQGFISALLRSSPLQKLGLWSYSIYMIHTFLFQLMKMTASYLGRKIHVDLVGWCDGDKLLLLGTPGHALLAALVISVVVVVPFAALSYRWIEKPAMDFARRGPAPHRGGAVAKASPAAVATSV